MMYSLIWCATEDTDTTKVMIQSLHNQEMYKYIDSHPNPRDKYIQTLLKRGELEVKMAEKLEKSFWNSLQDRLNLVKEKDLPYSLQASEKSWEKMKLISMKRILNPHLTRGLQKQRSLRY